MIYKFIYRCRRCSAVFDLGKINGLQAAELAMTHALDRADGSEITAEVFHSCDDDGTGVADIIGAEQKN